MIELTIFSWDSFRKPVSNSRVGIERICELCSFLANNKDLGIISAYSCTFMSRLYITWVDLLRICNLPPQSPAASVYCPYSTDALSTHDALPILLVYSTWYYFQLQTVYWGIRFCATWWNIWLARKCAGSCRHDTQILIVCKEWSQFANMFNPHSWIGNWFTKRVSRKKG